MSTAELPSFVRRISPPGPVWRSCATVMIHAIDAGWTPRTPLQAHVVICGFPRAGTTLLSLMMQTAYRGAKGFPRERSVVRVAYRLNRSHSLLISKRPDDVFYIDEIRRTYRHRRASVRFLLMLRDPRSVLTSMPAGRTDSYYVSPDRWSATYDRLAEAREESDCLVERSEDVITHLTETQAAIARFLSMEPQAPFEHFRHSVPEGFRQTALNGLRPLDPATTRAWTEPRHRARIRMVLEVLPQLPDVLIESGYESDREWLKPYQPSQQNVESQ